MCPHSDLGERVCPNGNTIPPKPVYHCGNRMTIADFLARVSVVQSINQLCVKVSVNLLYIFSTHARLSCLVLFSVRLVKNPSRVSHTQAIAFFFSLVHNLLWNGETFVLTYSKPIPFTLVCIIWCCFPSLMFVKNTFHVTHKQSRFSSP